MGDTEGRAPLISSTIRFASFPHFSTSYSPLVPFERLRLSLGGDKRHATIGGNVATAKNLFSLLRLVL